MSRKKRVVAQRPPADGPRRWLVPLAALALLGALVAAYHNCFHGQFVLDDQFRIADNPGIRRLWPIWSLLCAPLNISRPLAQLTFGINYAIHGLDPLGYHVVNVLIHGAGALVLFGVLRRTLRSPGLSAEFGAHAEGLALAVALLWLVHPLQTSAVTYIVQRDESLMGLLFLLALYAGIRAFENQHPGRRGWQALAVGLCAAGMACKQVMVVAPVVILLYDYFFMAGSIPRALRRAPRFYAALGATCLIPFVLLFLSPATETSGYGLSNLPAYLLTQCGVIGRYLRLAFVPYPQYLDYGWPLSREIMPVLLPGTIVLTLLALTVWATIRRRSAGFAGAWFFIILAPTSLLPGPDPAFEQRMYLPLAAVVALVVLGAFYLLRRVRFTAQADQPVPSAPPRWPLVVGAVLTLSVTGVFVFLTVKRNADFAHPKSLWRRVVEYAPEHSRGHRGLAKALLDEADKLEKSDEQAGLVAEALDEGQTAVRLQPEYGLAHFIVGLAYQRQGKRREAVAAYEEALRLVRLDSELADVNNNLGEVLMRDDQLEEARGHLLAALAHDREYPKAHNNLGVVLFGLGKKAEETRDAARGRELEAAALKEYELALQYDDIMKERIKIYANMVEAYRHLGDTAAAERCVSERARLQGGARGAVEAATLVERARTFFTDGKYAESVEAALKAVEFQPELSDAHYCLAAAYNAQGKMRLAIAECTETVRLKPDFAEAHNHLGSLLLDQNELGAAAEQFRLAVNAAPTLASAHCNLGLALFRDNKISDAIPEYLEAARLDPADVATRYNLGLAYLGQGQKQEARAQFEAVLKLAPEHAGAKAQLEQLRQAP